MSFSERLQKIIDRYNHVNAKMLQLDSFSIAELTKFAKEQADLREIAESAIEYNRLLEKLRELDSFLSDSSFEPEFKEMALSEKSELAAKAEEMIENLKVLLLPKDEDDEKDVILEIRAGTGGEEAALFAAALFRMYRRYAEKKGWRFEILSLSSTGLDGCKEATASISGKGVFARLKFESGVHRVQRVPETESSGRIHTSASTVAVLPEAAELDVQIEEKDLKIDVYRASGAGGQHVNTTDSAVRITHIPSGIVVCQQDEKSQHKNKAKALKILRARVYEVQRNKRNAEISALRKGQIGSGDRSERIRTYNYPQGRVSDHRINLTLYSLALIINEGELDPLINPLISDDRASRLAASEE